MLEVMEPGFETSVQDYPGRIGLGHLGYPPSGPLDSWSFRLANLLVGNPAGEAALECQLNGPTLRFQIATTIAVCGADMRPELDGVAVPLWQSVAARAGQVLTLSFTRRGARAYIAVAGGIQVPPVLGSRSTFHECGVGGMQGHALKKGQIVPLGEAPGTPDMRVREAVRPPFSDSRAWSVEAVCGPNDDWLDDDCVQRFFSFGWKVTGKSSRTGYRLAGPEWTFSRTALEKGPDHGSNPADIVDHGYPLGGVNLGGQTPIILLMDGYSLGGLINPFTIPTAALWKVGQACPGEKLFFRKVSVADAQALHRQMNAACTRDSLVAV